MAVAIEEDDRVKIVKELQDALKSLGVIGSPAEATKNERLKAILSRVLSRVESPTDRVRREQPGGSL